MPLFVDLYCIADVRAMTPEPLGVQPAELRDHLLREAVAEVAVPSPRLKSSKGSTASMVLLAPSDDSRSGAGYHGRDETIAPLRHGDDVRLSPGAEVQDPSKEGDRAGEAALLHEGAPPHLGQELLLGHHVSRVLDQQDQRIGGLRGDANHALPAKEDVPRDIQAERAELVEPVAAHALTS